MLKRFEYADRRERPMPPGLDELRQIVAGGANCRGCGRTATCLAGKTPRCQACRNLSALDLRSRRVATIKREDRMHTVAAIAREVDL